MSPQPPKTRRSRTPLAATACSLLFTITPIPLLLLPLLQGCGNPRVVTVPQTQPRQLAENVQAYVYVETKDGQRTRSANRTQLFEGEWVLSDPGK